MKQLEHLLKGSVAATINKFGIRDSKYDSKSRKNIGYLDKIIISCIYFNVILFLLHKNNILYSILFVGIKSCTDRIFCNVGLKITNMSLTCCNMYVLFVLEPTWHRKKFPTKMSPCKFYVNSFVIPSTSCSIYAYFVFNLDKMASLVAQQQTQWLLSLKSCIRLLDIKMSILENYSAAPLTILVFGFFAATYVDISGCH